ncbi:MAG TPA: TM2 domain-containing protein [Bacteroidales bacterium]|jgi:hypothetical protein|nr:TM2 domain-containing protein [Bacteroidales bacterium]HOC41275.1 TM2 domain-containing protein [Bacteroidales bacterium]HOJ24108.1 TM2 domain-containing protein [Bacteroidales bacterium]HPX46530.1 TM2 domain-containing protein [Bacteroidales bacterium]HQC60672.1 TM2 domain-containing protein [Bacteroidales bacterium]
MKKTKIFLFLGVAVMMALTSCTMQKRVYTSGYHIEWLNGNNATVKQNNSQTEEQKNLNKTTIAAVSTINEGKMSIDKTQNTEINNENNNPVTTVNENFVASTTNDSSVYTSQKTNNWYSSPVQKNSNTQNNSKTIVKQSTTNTENTTSENTKSGGKSWIATFLLCLFLGSIGIHRFYLGYTWQGIVQLLTAGGLGIWTLIDLIRIITKDLQPKNGRYKD